MMAPLELSIGHADIAARKNISKLFQITQVAAFQINLQDLPQFRTSSRVETIYGKLNFELIMTSWLPPNSMETNLRRPRCLR